MQGHGGAGGARQILGSLWHGKPNGIDFVGNSKTNSFPQIRTQQVLLFA